MPKLIEDATQVLEWTKGPDGQLLAGSDGKKFRYAIEPEGSKFVLMVDGAPACKGPQKVCKGFAQDIADGKLVKLSSGNWGSPPAKAETAPKSKKGKQAKADITTAKGQKQFIAEAAKKLVEAPTGPIQRQETADEIIQQPGSIPAACRLLGQQHPICLLPPGSFFYTSTGQHGRFVEMVGGDAKVDLLNGNSQTWSNASPVYWLPCRVDSLKGKASRAKVEAQGQEGKEPAAASAPSPADKPQAAPKVAKPRTENIFGFSPTGVVRWCGKNGFSLDQVNKIVGHFSVNLSPSTLKIQFKAGQKGERGDPPVLTADQTKELNKIAGRK